MSRYPHNDDAVQLIKETADLVQIVGENVNLKRAGANYKGLCPFHSEKTPSFIVNPARRTFHCFGCNEGGDVFTFVMKYHHLSFPEAIKELARRYQIALPEKTLSPEEQERARKREKLYEVNEQAAKIFHDFLLTSAQAEPARKYLLEREIPEEIITSFQLGYAPDSWDFLSKKFSAASARSEALAAGLVVSKDRGGSYDRFRDRVMFPIFGQTGQVVAFGGRILGEGQPKYMNSPESAIFDKSRTLFGLFQQKDHIRKSRQGIIVEGNFDLLSLISHGIHNAVAPLGTALTPLHIRILKGYADEAVLLFDGDPAGIQAAMRAVPLFLSEQLPARIVALPAEYDPDSYVREHGREALHELIDGADSLPEFVFDRLVERFGMGLDGKNRILAELRPIVAAIDDGNLQKTFFINHFSQKLGIGPEQLARGLVTSVAMQSAPVKGRENSRLNLSQKERQLLEFLIIFPEFLGPFIDAGLEEVIAGPSGLVLFEQMKNTASEDGQQGPERLLDLLPHGSERSFVSGILTSIPSCSDEKKENEAHEKIAWLKKNCLLVAREQIIQQLNEAQRLQDEALLMELLQEKKRIDESLIS